MAGVLALQDRFSHEVYVSEESAEAGRPIWHLLRVGWEMGVSTSLTETEVVSSSNVLANRFHTLAETWREECAHLSSIREMVLHPAYQQIIGMGQNSLPFIFAEMERRPDHWFWALRSITGENPVPPEHQGDVAEMTRRWLDWAKKRGIRW